MNFRKFSKIPKFIKYGSSIYDLQVRWSTEAALRRRRWRWRTALEDDHPRRSSSTHAAVETWCRTARGSLRRNRVVRGRGRRGRRYRRGVGRARRHLGFRAPTRATPPPRPPTSFRRRRSSVSRLLQRQRRRPPS